MKRCEGPCDLPDIASEATRARCRVCGSEYVVTDRWGDHIGLLWEPAWAVDETYENMKRGIGPNGERGIQKL